MPHEIDGILEKALEKDRELRYQSAADLRADLKRLARNSSSGHHAAAVSSASGAVAASATLRAADPGSSASTAAAAPVQQGRTGLWISIAALVLVAAAAGAWWFLRQPAWPLTNISLKQLTDSGNIERIAMSPDGKTLAEIKNDKGQRSLWIRNIPTNQDTQVIPPSGQGYVDVTFSVDGNQIYYSAEPPDSRYIRTLYRVSVFGGTPQALIHDADSSASFSPDGSRFVYLRQTPQDSGHFAEMHISNTDLSSDTIAYQGPNSTSFPRWSRGGKSIVWDERPVGGDTTLMVLDVATNKTRSLPEPEGKLIRRWQDPLPGEFTATVASTPDSDTAQVLTISTVNGASHAVTNDLTTYDQPSSSADGKIVGVIASEIKSTVSIFNVGESVPVRTLDLRVTPSRIQWLPGGAMLLTSTLRSSLLNLDTQAITPLTFAGLQPTSSASICPDGTVVFAAVPKGVNHSVLYSIQQNGQGMKQLTTDGPVRVSACVAGNVVFYGKPVPTTTTQQVWMLKLGNPSPVKLPIVTGAFGFVPSNDGRYVVVGVGAGESLYADRYDLTTPGARPQRLPIDLRMTLQTLDFTPDGNGIIYPGKGDGQESLLTQSFQGGPAAKVFDASPVPIMFVTYSPDGKQIAILRRSTTSNVALIQDQSGKN